MPLQTCKWRDRFQKFLPLSLEMQRQTEQPLCRQMAELRLMCENETKFHLQKADSAFDSYQKSMQSTKFKAEENARDQAKLGYLKDHLNQLEDNLVAVKTDKKTKHISVTDALSSTKARIEELEKIMQAQRARRDEFRRIISQQLLALAALEGKSDHAKHSQDFEKAISWYNRVLGLQIEGGLQGVKFIFSKIDLKNPSREFSFTIRHDNDTYTLLDCDSYLDDTEELIQDLNETNGLFKFVRIMREKFWLAASNGSQQQPTYHLDSPSTSLTAPAPSVSVSNNTGSLITQSDSHFEESVGLNKPSKIVRARASDTMSPGSAFSLRHTPRMKAKK